MNEHTSATIENVRFLEYQNRYLAGRVSQLAQYVEDLQRERTRLQGLNRKLAESITAQELADGRYDEPGNFPFAATDVVGSTTETIESADAAL